MLKYEYVEQLILMLLCIHDEDIFRVHHASNTSYIYNCFEQFKLRCYFLFFFHILFYIIKKSWVDRAHCDQSWEIASRKAKRVKIYGPLSRANVSIYWGRCAARASEEWLSEAFRYYKIQQLIQLLWRCQSVNERTENIKKERYRVCV